VPEPAPDVPRARRATPAPTPEAPLFNSSASPGGRDRTPPFGRPASPPPLRVSPPPVIVPVRGAFPWAAVIAAAVASGTLFGVTGFWMGLRQRPAPAPSAVATDAANQPAASSPATPGTDVIVPAPLVPGGGATAPVSSAPPPSPAPQAANAAKEPAKVAARPPATSKAKPESVVGSLVVETRPAGARVVLDGKQIGVTPLTLGDLRTGSHPLRIERAGYKTIVTSVVIKSGERARVAVSLELSGVPGPWMPPSR
jgi:hypothetical protein